MSSLRNAVTRRPHKERSQPESRQKWGLLEKHKDYSLRAKDYNLKKAKLARLRQKARDANPDEFAFGMMSEGSSRQGKHGKRDTSKSIDLDTAKLLKTQDSGYLRTMNEKIRRKLDRIDQEHKLQQGMAGVETGKNGRKTIFADDVQDQARIMADVVKEENENEDDEYGKKGSPVKESQWKKDIEAEQQAYKEMMAARRLKKRATESRAKLLEGLRTQHEQLTTAEQELDLQRQKMNHSVGGVNKYGLKWKVPERKK